MEENLRRLSNCLNQASQGVQELAADSGRNVVTDATVGETSKSTNTSITMLGQPVSRARATMRQSTTRGLYFSFSSYNRMPCIPTPPYFFPSFTRLTPSRFYPKNK